jgi:hypothetical protein
MIFKVIGLLLLYVLGIILVIVLGALHAVFRILHTMMNLLAQCRRADIDVLQEFHYESEDSEGSGSELEREREDLAYVDEFERNEQRLMILGQRQPPTPSKGGDDEVPKIMSRPKRTREDIKEARVARKAKKIDDAKRIVALLNNQPDPGVTEGFKSELTPPKFVSPQCAFSALVASAGMFMVSLTYMFYALSYATLLGIVALISMMFPSTTVGGMRVVKEFQDQSDIIARPVPKKEAEIAPVSAV